MKTETIGKTKLSPLHLGSFVSYELSGNIITVRMLGVFPIKHVRINDIRTLRLATRDEVSSLAFMMNLMLYYCWRSAYRPIYLLQAADGKYYFLRLSHAMQNRLLLAMKRVHRSDHAIREAA